MREQLLKEDKKVRPNQLPFPVVKDIVDALIREIPELDFGEVNENTYAEDIYHDTESNLLYWEASVDELYEQMDEDRGVSDLVVMDLEEKLMEKDELDPILTYNKKFYDGGHRLTAYKNTGRETIPAVDIAQIIEDEREHIESDQ